MAVSNAMSMPSAPPGAPAGPGPLSPAGPADTQESAAPSFAEEAPIKEEQATDAEEAELERAIDALGDVLYSNDKSHQVISDKLNPEDKVGSIATASLELVKEMDSQLDLDEVVVPSFTEEVVKRVVDLYENTHGEELDQSQASAAFTATWEGVLAAFGWEQDDHDAFIGSMSSKQLDTAQKGYKTMLDGYGG